MEQIEYICLEPIDALKGIIDSIWMLKNCSDDSRERIIIPDGKIDLFFFLDENGFFEIFISGICTEPVIKPPFPKSVMFAISFYPIAAEYIFKQSFAEIKNHTKILRTDYLGFCKNDLEDFGYFYKKACEIISLQLTKKIDLRKQKLFEILYTSKGETTVKEISEQIFWSSREINRYFNHWFGLPLKSYLNIIRFSNSLKQLKKGSFFPELNYADQSHFIRHIKKFAGVKPSILSKNENDRFIQLNLLPEN